MRFGWCAEILGNASRSGGVLSPSVRPVQKCPPAAGDAQLVGRAVHDSRASAQSAATNRTLTVVCSQCRLERYLRLTNARMTFAPTADLRGALRRPLLSHLWIDVRSPRGCRSG